jgi:hypothetical protein
MLSVANKPFMLHVVMLNCRCTHTHTHTVVEEMIVLCRSKLECLALLRDSTLPVGSCPQILDECESD